MNVMLRFILYLNSKIAILSVNGVLKTVATDGAQNETNVTTQVSDATRIISYVSMVLVIILTLAYMGVYIHYFKKLDELYLRKGKAEKKVEDEKKLKNESKSKGNVNSGGSVSEKGSSKSDEDVDKPKTQVIVYPKIILRPEPTVVPQTFNRPLDRSALPPSIFGQAPAGARFKQAILKRGQSPVKKSGTEEMLVVGNLPSAIPQPGSKIL